MNYFFRFVQNTVERIFLTWKLDSNFIQVLKDVKNNDI